MLSTVYATAIPSICLSIVTCVYCIKMAEHIGHWPPSWKIQMVISPQRIIQFTPCFVLSSVFGVGRSNGAISSWTKFNRNVVENNAPGVIRLVTI